MQINSINTTSTNYSFNGLWGNTKSHSIPYEDIRTECYERIYYPFQDESDTSIQENMNSYNSQKCEEYVTYRYTALLGATLPILAKEYSLYKQGRLSSDARNMIERTIRTMVK